LHGPVGLADVEEVLFRVIDHPEDREVDVDDVLVAREHQRLSRQVLGRAATVADAEADLDAIDAGNLRPPDRLHWRGKVIAQSRRRDPVDRTEPEDDAELVRLYLVEAAQPPKREGDREDDHDTRRAAKPAGQHAAQLVLAALDDVLDLGALRAASPGARAAAPRAATAATALIGPRHRARSLSC